MMVAPGDYHICVLRSPFKPSFGLHETNATHLDNGGFPRWAGFVFGVTFVHHFLVISVTSRTLLTHLAVARSLLDGFCPVMTLLSQSFQLRGIGPIFNFIIESWQVDSYHPIPQL